MIFRGFDAGHNVVFRSPEYKAAEISPSGYVRTRHANVRYWK